MGIYTAVLTAQSVSAANDVFEINAPSGSRVRIREIRIGQYSDFGDAAAEILSVRVLRGYSAGGSSGVTAPTPRNVLGHSTAPAAGSTVKVYDTGLASDTGTAGVQELISDTWNIAAGWWYYPPEEEMIWMEKGDRLVVRLTAPADAVTMNATLVFEEMGLT